MPSTSIVARSLAESFAADRAKHRIGFVPFIPAGYPDLATTIAVAEGLDAVGATAIEIGFPFSDPIADGPIIQAAFTAALAKKITVEQIFQAASQITSRIATPIVGMLSYSIVYRYSAEKFFAKSKAAGFAGLIIPDLPPPEAESICRQIRAAGLETILLVAPTTTPARRQEIARLSSGFVYYLSVSGITGTRDELPADAVENVRTLKKLTSIPVCVGFGVSKPKHLADLARVADGAIVGSAIVKRMTEQLSAGPQAIARGVGEYCRELLRGRESF
jgi:tryptophan synthase alpha chain